MKSSIIRLSNIRLVSTLVAGLALQVLAFAPMAGAADIAAGDKAPLPLILPEPTTKGTPEELPKGPNIDPPPTKDPAPFMAPKGVKNLALGKPVTSSTAPFTGELSQITDGKKEPDDSDAVEFKKGAQYIQVDLGATAAIYAIAMWHDHRYVQAFHAVIVQISDDPEFKTGVQTVFNNDLENVAMVGAGTDREYFETKWGKIVDAKGVKGRYVRSYTKGSSKSALNCWQEIEVYGLPAK
jgi:hypothetical protein